MPSHRAVNDRACARVMDWFRSRDKHLADRVCVPCSLSVYCHGDNMYIYSSRAIWQGKGCDIRCRVRRARFPHLGRYTKAALVSQTQRGSAQLGNRLHIALTSRPTIPAGLAHR